jgi:signal transduction histidine kinase
MIKVISKVINVGVQEQLPVDVNLRIRFSNAVFISFPVVYLVFIFIDLNSFLQPIQSLKWDQFIIPIFILVSIGCIYFNSLNRFILARLIFIISWPLCMHVIPIIVQDTPPDYYFATPLGVILYSVLVQALFSLKKNRKIFLSLFGLNILMLIYFIPFLKMNDPESGRHLASLVNDYWYFLDVFIYWLLFGLVTQFLIVIIEKNILEITAAKEVISRQSHDLVKSLSDLKQTQARLIQSEKMASIGVFTSGIAHEINNPLNIINSGREALWQSLKRNSIPNEADIQSAIVKIDEGLRRSDKIIKSLLNLSYPNQGKASRLQWTDVNEAVKSTLLLMNTRIKSSLQIVTDFCDNGALLMYPDKLHQVLYNIISNAVDEVHGEGSIKTNETIKISTSREEKYEANYFLIEIFNSGSFIEEEHLSKIYDPFFTTKQVGKGTGLGLWIAYSLMQEHNGRIEVLNINNGVLFKLYFPIEEGD